MSNRVSMTAGCKEYSCCSQFILITALGRTTIRRDWIQTNCRINAK